MESIYNDKYYHPSGRISPVFILWFLIGAAAIALVSFVYAIGMYHNPYVYLSIGITIAFGLLLGLVTIKVGVWGKARSKAVCYAVAIVYFAVFVYVHFTAYAAVVFRDINGRSVIDMEWFWILIENPSVLYELYSEFIVPLGVWSFGDSPDSSVSGAILIAIWSAEHIVIAGITILMLKRSSALSTPFFEIPGKWGVEKECAYGWEQQSSNIGAITTALENGNTEFFRTLAAANPASPQSCGFSCFYDPSGESREVYLSFYNLTIEFTNNGRINKKKDYIVKNLVFPEAAYTQLESIAEEAVRAAQEQTQEQKQPQLYDEQQNEEGDGAV